MLKLLLCIVVTAVSSYLGYVYSLRLYRRKSILEMFLRELKNSLTHIRYSSANLAQIYTDRFTGYKFVENTPFYDQWIKMLKQYEKELIKDDIKILNSFGRTLGCSDTDGEINNINMYIDMLSLSIKDAENNINLKSKLYRTLGLSLGLVLSILLI